MVVKNYVNLPFACEMEPRILLPVRLRYVGSSDILRVLWLQSEWKLESLYWNFSICLFILFCTQEARSTCCDKQCSLLVTNPKISPVQLRQVGNNIFDIFY
jgi:hypothetical protein